MDQVYTDMIVCSNIENILWKKNIFKNTMMENIFHGKESILSRKSLVNGNEFKRTIVLKLKTQISVQILFP